MSGAEALAKPGLQSEEGEFSHGNGYKVDISRIESVDNYTEDNYTEENFTHTGTRGDGAELYEDAEWIFISAAAIIGPICALVENRLFPGSQGPNHHKPPPTLMLEQPGFLLSVAALVSGVGAIAAHYRPGGRTAYRLLKPLTTLLILATVLSLPPGPGRAYALLIAAGLAFALVGDILLMFAERNFALGIASFAITHALYIAAFSMRSGITLMQPATALAVLMAAGLLRLVWGGVRASLRMPVLVYVLLITAMLGQAAGAALVQQSAAAITAAAGAALFFVSDAILALDRFRSPFRAAQALVLSTYWLGQWLIASSI